MVERFHNGPAGERDAAIARTDTHIPTVRAAGNRPRARRGADAPVPSMAGGRPGAAPDEDTDLVRRYAPFAAVYGVLGAGLLHAASRRGRVELGPLELVESVLATFFVTRVVARDKIGSVVREPFVEPAPGADPSDAHGEAKQPTGSGMRYAIGELLTCTRCLGPWAAAAITTVQVVAPRQGRVATRVMALAGASNLLHALFAWVTAQANAIGRDS